MKIILELDGTPGSEQAVIEVALDDILAKLYISEKHQEIELEQCGDLVTISLSDFSALLHTLTALAESIEGAEWHSLTR